MLRTVNLRTALSLGTQREQLEQRTATVWPRPCLLRPLFLRLVGILVGGKVVDVPKRACGRKWSSFCRLISHLKVLLAETHTNSLTENLENPSQSGRIQPGLRDLVEASGRRFSLSTQHNASSEFKTRTEQQQAEMTTHVRFFVKLLLPTKISRIAQNRVISHFEPWLCVSPPSLRAVEACQSAEEIAGGRPAQS